MEPIVYNISGVVIEVALDEKFEQEIIVTMTSAEGGWSSTEVTSRHEWAFEEMIFDSIAVNQPAKLGNNKKDC